MWPVRLEGTRLGTTEQEEIKLNERDAMLRSNHLLLELVIQQPSGSFSFYCNVKLKMMIKVLLIRNNFVLPRRSILMFLKSFQNVTVCCSGCKIIYLFIYLVGWGGIVPNKKLGYSFFGSFCIAGCWFKKLKWRPWRTSTAELDRTGAPFTSLKWSPWKKRAQHSRPKMTFSQYYIPFPTKIKRIRQNCCL